MTTIDPHSHPDYQRRLEAVRENGHALSLVPTHLCTAELCLEAVRQDGRALRCVPAPQRTAKLYREAVRQNGRALEYVPAPLRTAELCREAVRQYGLALQWAPEPQRTAELCLESVRQNGQALYWVPAPQRAPDLCREAVRQNGLALQWVPEPLCTSELCREAVGQDGRALEFVPKPLLRQLVLGTPGQKQARQPARSPEQAAGDGKATVAQAGTKLVAICLSAYTRVEYREIIEVPACFTERELDNLVRTRYDQLDVGEFEADPEYWERGGCRWESADPGESPTMQAFVTQRGLHIERADSWRPQEDSPTAQDQNDYPAPGG